MVDEQSLEVYEKYLREQEKSKNTIEKYLRDIRHFYRFAAGREISRELMLEYKEQLKKNYKISSANSMLVAVNQYFRFLGKEEYSVRTFRTQRQIFRDQYRDLDEDEYRRLVEAAILGGDERLSCIIQTMVMTGIRISELKFITVEALKRQMVEIDCKNKRRVILLPDSLKKLLLHYCESKGIRKGCIFITRSGAPVDRRNVWASMKRLCETAGVQPSKVFPHNMRHLFAKSYYLKMKDIVRLADYLGHSSIETTRRYVMTSTMETCLKELELGLLVTEDMR